MAFVRLDHLLAGGAGLGGPQPRQLSRTSVAQEFPRRPLQDRSGWSGPGHGQHGHAQHGAHARPVSSRLGPLRTFISCLVSCRAFEGVGAVPDHCHLQGMKSSYPRPEAVGVLSAGRIWIH